METVALINNNSIGTRAITQPLITNRSLIVNPQPIRRNNKIVIGLPNSGLSRKFPFVRAARADKKIPKGTILYGYRAPDQVAYDHLDLVPALYDDHKQSTNRLNT